MLRGVGGRDYQLVVEGEVSDRIGLTFAGLSVRREGGNTVLTGRVRDQAELQGILQHVGDLGLTLLEATALDTEPALRSRSRSPE
jgi:hypothetical protein